MRKIRSRLQNNLGESISETLVALLISALALTLLASMISSTLRMVTQSRTKIADYYTANNAVAAYTATGEKKSPATASFAVNDDTDSLNLASKNITLYINDLFSNTKVIAYESAIPAPSPDPSPGP